MQLHERMTASRKRWLEALLDGPKAPDGKGFHNAPCHCLRLGWTERGPIINGEFVNSNFADINAEYGTDWFRRDDFLGFYDRLTNKGRDALER